MPTNWRPRFPLCCTSNPATAIATAVWGTTVLHSCFEGTHGAQCSVCLKELYYSYSMNKKGKTAAQIRQGIIRVNGSR